MKFEVEGFKYSVCPKRLLLTLASPSAFFLMKHSLTLPFLTAMCSNASASPGHSTEGSIIITDINMLPGRSRTFKPAAKISGISCFRNWYVGLMLLACNKQIDEQISQILQVRSEERNKYILFKYHTYSFIYINIYMPCVWGGGGHVMVLWGHKFVKWHRYDIGVKRRRWFMRTFSVSP